MIRIINKYTYTLEPNEILVYVGRGSPLGNPFPITKTDTRDIVCDKYRDYIRDQLLKGNMAILAELKRILQLSQHHNVALQCFCAPKRCHAETILEVLNILKGVNDTTVHI